MGRAARKGAAGGSLRDGGFREPAPEQPGIDRYAKTAEQKLLIDVAEDLTRGGQKPVPLQEVLERVGDTIGAQEANLHIRNMTEGFGWEDSGNKEMRTRVPLMRVEDIGQGQVGLNLATPEYAERRAYLEESSPWGYAGQARAVSERNQGALLLANPGIEEEMVQSLIRQTPFDPALASRYISEEEIADESQFLLEPAREALRELSRKGAVEYQNGKVRLSSDSHFIAEQAKGYSSQFGEDSLKHRQEEMSLCNRRAQNLAQGPHEEAIVGYLWRSNPRWEEDRISYNQIAKDLEPLGGGQEMRRALSSLVSRGVLEQTSGERGGYNFALSPSLAAPNHPAFL